MCYSFIYPIKNLLLLLLVQFAGMSGIYSLIQAQNIQYNLDCSGGPGQAQLTVESPVGSNWSYAINGESYQTSPVFNDIFPGNHWLFVQNASGELDSIRFNANCGLEKFSCGDCDRSGTFFQIYSQNGVIVGLDLETNQFSSLPNSPAGIHINAIGMNPKDSLAYGMKRRFSNELIVVDAQGTSVNLGSVEDLPVGDYASGDFDAEGYLHIKGGLTRELFKIDVSVGKMVERYFIDQPTKTSDITYNIVDSLFYGADDNGNLWSFSPIERQVVLIGSSFLSGDIGAMYSDRSGRVFGLENSSGRLYQFDLSDGSVDFIMTTTSTSYNDGFNCKNIFFNNIPPPTAEIECSTDSDSVNITIVEPTGDDLEFKINSSNFERRRYWTGLPSGQTEIVVRRQGSCLSDTVILNLMPNFSTESSQVIETCEEFISASGIRWDESGIYQDTILNSMGCDSIINYEITILESTESLQSVEVCDEYISPTGKQWDESGTFRDTLQNANGCDSILTFDLTIFETFESTQFIEACNEYTTPDGQLWAQSGTFLDTLLSSQGCDSVITYDITILERSESIQTIEACDEFTSPSGNRWSQTGTFLDAIQNSVGCDSILTYNLTILESSESSQSILSCDPFLWNGILLDSSGTYEHRATNEVGCDSIAQMNFTLTPTLDTQISVTSCRPFRSPDGDEIWSETGLYRDTILSSLGCDSIITVNLVIGDVSAEWSLNEPACPDRLVSWLRIDTITHQGPHYLIRNELDTILISSIPIEVNDLPPGEHRIQFVSSDSCESPVSLIQVEGLELPEIRLIGPTEIDICDPPTLYQLETNMPGDYQWYSNSALECDTCSSTEVFSYQEGVLGVNFIAENGCTAREEFDLKLNGTDVQYYIPNVFSPNGDGINDYFTLFAGNGEVDQIELF